MFALGLPMFSAVSQGGPHRGLTAQPTRMPPRVPRKRPQLDALSPCRALRASFLSVLLR